MTVVVVVFVVVVVWFVAAPPATADKGFARFRSYIPASSPPKALFQTAGSKRFF
jgi:hypothetical protein